MYILCQILSLHFEKEISFTERGDHKKIFFGKSKKFNICAFKNADIDLFAMFLSCGRPKNIFEPNCIQW